MRNMWTVIVLVGYLASNLAALSGEFRSLQLSPPPKTRVKVGVVVPVEEREKEDLVYQAIEMYNSKSQWMMVEPVLVFTSNEDSLLRLHSIFDLNAKKVHINL